MSMVQVVCENPACQKSFSVKSHRLLKGQGRFCSMRCFGICKQNKVTVTCQYIPCGKEFETVPSKIARGISKYCSRACLGAATREMPAEERFWSFVDKSGGPDACWPWIGSIHAKKGYGHFNCPLEKLDETKHDARRYSKAVQAHRYSYELANGPILDSLWVLHRCDVRACVNPAHLFLGTNDDNMKDAVSKKRMRYGERHPMARVKNEDVYAIRDLEGKMTKKLIAERYGISEDSVRRIWRRETFYHLPDRPVYRLMIQLSLFSEQAKP